VKDKIEVERKGEYFLSACPANLNLSDNEKGGSTVERQ